MADQDYFHHQNPDLEWRRSWNCRRTLLSKSNFMKIQKKLEEELLQKEKKKEKNAEYNKSITIKIGIRILACLVFPVVTRGAEFRLK